MNLELNINISYLFILFYYECYFNINIFLYNKLLRIYVKNIIIISFFIKFDMGTDHTQYFKNTILNIINKFLLV